MYASRHAGATPNQLGIPGTVYHSFTRAAGDAGDGTSQLHASEQLVMLDTVHHSCMHQSSWWCRIRYITAVLEQLVMSDTVYHRCIAWSSCYRTCAYMTQINRTCYQHFGNQQNVPNPSNFIQFYSTKSETRPTWFMRYMWYKCTNGDNLR